MLSQTNLSHAEKYLRKAVTLGLSMDHDMAMVKLTLASIAMSKNRRKEAQTLISEAKKLDKHGMLTDQINMTKQQMKRANMPNQHFGAQRGGRRR